MNPRLTFIFVVLLGLVLFFGGCAGPLCEPADVLKKTYEKQYGGDSPDLWTEEEVLQVASAYRDCFYDEKKSQQDKKRVQQEILELLVPYVMEKRKDVIESKVAEARPFESASAYTIHLDRLNQFKAQIEEFHACLAELDPLKLKPKKESALIELTAKYSEIRQWIEGETDTLVEDRDNKLARIDALIRQSSEQREQANWNDAMGSLDQALAIFPRHLNAKNERKRTMSARDESYQTEAEQFKAPEDYWRTITEVSNVSQKIVKAEADLTGLQSLRARYNKEREPSARVADILAQEIRVKREEWIQWQIGQLSKQEKYYQAYSLAQKSGLSGFRDHAVWFADEWQVMSEGSYAQKASGYYAERARAFAIDDQSYYAFAAAAKAKLLAQGNAGDLDPDYSRSVDNSISREIGIAYFDSPRSGRAFTESLEAYLQKRLPYGFTVSVADKDSILWQSGAEGLQERIELVNDDYRWVVFGNLSVKLDKTIRSGNVTEYIEIPQLVKNESFEVEEDFLLKEFGKKREKWPYQPKKTLELKLTQKFEYEEHTGKTEGAVGVTARIYDGDNEALHDLKRFVNHKFGQSATQDYFREEENKVGDPNDLPADEEFLAELSDPLVEQVGLWLEDHFWPVPRQQHFRQQAEGQLLKKSRADAVRAAVQGYYYCLKDNIPVDDKWFRELRQMALIDLTEGEATL